MPDTPLEKNAHGHWKIDPNTFLASDKTSKNFSLMPMIVKGTPKSPTKTGEAWHMSTAKGLKRKRKRTKKHHKKGGSNKNNKKRRTQSRR